MFPSINTSVTNSAPIPRYHNLQASPLTTDDVIRDSALKNMSTGCPFRMNGELSWIENEQRASLNSRVDFINKMTAHILEKIPLRDTPLTFISLGSTGLLTEYFIHQQLEKSGYQDVNWRIINPDYQKSDLDDCRKEFREKINGNVRVFTEEQEYLKKSLGEGDKKLAENDRSRGAVIVLAINLPMMPYFMEANSDSHMFLRGTAVKDASKANAIYLMVADIREREPMQEMINQMHKEEQEIFSNNIVKYSIDKQGRYKAEFSQFADDRIYRSTETHLKSLDNISSLEQNKIELNDIDKALDKYISDLPKIGQYGVKSFISDYDNSVNELNNFFIDSPNQTLFVSFDKNEISFERKNYASPGSYSPPRMQISQFSEAQMTDIIRMRDIMSLMSQIYTTRQN